MRVCVTSPDDGIPDYIALSASGTWSVSIGTGTGFAAFIPVSGSFALSSETEDCGVSTPVQSGLYDIDGDGKADIVWSSQSNPGTVRGRGWSAAAVVPGAPDAGRLVQVDNGYGAQTKITYRSAKEDATTLHQVPFPEIVVTSVQTTGSQGLGGDLSATLYRLRWSRSALRSALDTFSFPGYRRTVELQIPDARPPHAGAGDRHRHLWSSESPDPYGLVVRAGMLPPSTVDRRYDLYLRARTHHRCHHPQRQPRSDASALLATMSPAIARRIAVTHYEWGTRLLVG